MRKITSNLFVFAIGCVILADISIIGCVTGGVIAAIGAYLVIDEVAGYQEEIQRLKRRKS